MGEQGAQGVEACTDKREKVEQPIAPMLGKIDQTECADHEAPSDWCNAKDTEKYMHRSP